MPDSLQYEEEAIYYSSWQYGAIHVLLSIKQFQTREAISKKLEIPLPRVDQVLEFLVKTGLCRKERIRYLTVKPLLHLDKSSPLISKHHTNWRLRTMMAFDQNIEENLHYSSVFTVAKKDLPRVQEILAEALAKALKVINPSPEEEVAAVCIDLFKI
jgi:predicted transcriptional regulator